MPKDSLLWIIIFAVTLFLRIHKGAFFIFLILFALIAPIFDPFFDYLGYNFLSLSFIVRPYTFLLSIPFIAFMKINNSVVIGSFFVGMLCYIPFYMFSHFFIVIWRTKISFLLKRNRFIKAIYKIPFIQKIVLFLKAGSI